MKRNGPRGIPSGGMIITVDGTNFKAFCVFVSFMHLKFKS